MEVSMHVSDHVVTMCRQCAQPVVETRCLASYKAPEECPFASTLLPVSSVFLHTHEVRERQPR